MIKEKKLDKEFERLEKILEKKVINVYDLGALKECLNTHTTKQLNLYTVKTYSLLSFLHYLKGVYIMYNKNKKEEDIIKHLEEIIKVYSIYKVNFFHDYFYLCVRNDI